MKNHFTGDTLEPYFACVNISWDAYNELVEQLGHLVVFTDVEENNQAYRGIQLGKIILLPPMKDKRNGK